MINHHPKASLLLAFSKGQLSASLSIAVSAHIDKCEFCMHQVLALQENNALELDCSDIQTEEWIDDEMVDAITDEDYELHPKQSLPLQLNIKGYDYILPRSLNSVQLSHWLKLGKISRASLDLSEGEVHTNLLHIEKGGSIPSHTHKGFELTVLLAGEFEDEHGKYVPGDFIWLNGSNTHTPKTETGCLCLTVANDALHFVQGLSKALNPVGRLIY